LSLPPLLQVLESADKAQPLGFHRFKKYAPVPVRSTGPFVGIIADNPIPPGQIAQLYGEPLTTIRSTLQGRLYLSTRYQIVTVKLHPLSARRCCFYIFIERKKQKRGMKEK